MQLNIRETSGLFKRYTLFFIICFIFSLNNSSVLAQTAAAAEVKEVKTDLDSGLSKGAFWLTDYKEALKKAKKTNKYLFIDFTGSDWCGWCIKLEDQVFSKKYFQDEIKIDFIPVQIDYPQYKTLTDLEKKTRRALAEQFQISGYPTIVLTDSQGKIFGRTGYQEGGAKEYVAHIKKMIKFKDELDKLETKAESAKGIEKARLLHSLVKKRINSNLTSDNDGYIKEIRELDKDNKAGLNEIYECKEKMEQLGRALQKGKDPDEALGELDKLLETYKKNSELQQDIYFFKSMIYARGKNNLKGAAKFLKLALDSAPDSDLAPTLKGILKKIENAGQ
jgi:thioredoxin-related protein